MQSRPRGGVPYAVGARGLVHPRRATAPRRRELLSGEPVDAAEAHRIGLVNAVVPQAELVAHSRQWLGKVLANAPVAAALIVEAVDLGLNSGLDEGLRYEALAFGLVAATEDRREGTRAFLEKRKPAFAGK